MPLMCSNPTSLRQLSVLGKAGLIFISALQGHTAHIITMRQRLIQGGVLATAMLKWGCKACHVTETNRYPAACLFQASQTAQYKCLYTAVLSMHTESRIDARARLDLISALSCTERPRALWQAVDVWASSVHGADLCRAPSAEYSSSKS